MKQNNAAGEAISPRTKLKLLVLGADEAELDRICEAIAMVLSEDGNGR